jgi:S-(hydroxymethyl)glutathione dehydrogenase/alcohol dehydrogenase
MREGEVLVEIKATGICHTDEFTRSGADPEGLFPAILGHEGAGVVVEVGPGVTSLKPGDHVIPLYTPECRECEYCLQPEDQPVPGDPLDPGPGPDAGRHQPVLLRSMAKRSCTTWAARPSPTTRCCPRSRWPRSAKDAPFDKICYIGCGVTTGIGAVINTAKVEIGANVVVFGLGGIGLNVIQGAAAGRRRHDRRRRHQPGKKALGPRSSA